MTRLVGAKGQRVRHIAQRVVLTGWQRLFDEGDAPLRERLGKRLDLVLFPSLVGIYDQCGIWSPAANGFDAFKITFAS